MGMDQLSICLTTLSNLSDRRIDRFMDSHHNNDLPPFLCAGNTGISLGLMGGQFMSASLTSENRSLCNPVSTQSLTSTGDFQDIVSLGLVAARKANDILDNVAYVIAFELICAAQAAELRNKELLSKRTKNLYHKTRSLIPFIKENIPISDYIELVASHIKSGEMVKEDNIN
jgi:histidine ammonia-lyase